LNRRNFAALENVNIILSSAIPEGIVFRARVPKGLVIRVWCVMDEDDMIEELIREFTEITIEERLKNLECSETLSGSISHILTQLSNPVEGNIKHIGGGSQMEIDFETWKRFVENAKITKVEKFPGSLYFEFDTGMVSHIYSEKPLQFDFNWKEGYEFLGSKALDIYIKRMRECFENEQMRKIVREQHWIKKHSKKTHTP